MLLLLTRHYYCAWSGTGDKARLGDLDIRVSAELVSEPDWSISFVVLGYGLISQATLRQLACNNRGHLSPIGTVLP